MQSKPIRTEDDLQAAFQRLEAIFQAEAGTPDADEMQRLVTSIEAYERQHYPIDPQTQATASTQPCTKYAASACP
jgi:HTH-type transcriptional regulator/antitoxin HigA